ncbi:galectin-12 isoform X8 [Mirounga leonina]|uniref:galectin-12 isoform X8 n=1 Tax=Mirounga leonina TaxID=9715 RepID=UPI00156BFCCB|nr:galectin-12 isoform X8 [Mirounga leonina]
MPSWRHSTPMSPGEKLDPLPDPFILQPPVFHPVLPYVTTIFGGLRAGKMVMLQGAVPLEARRFQVDFQCGCSLHPRPDIAIHFNPRFHTTKPHVICNTLHLERWQAEARWPHLPLQRGAYFLILFLFGNEEMKVSVNGQHFLHYCYRLPLSRVDTLAIFGDILVEAVGFLNINPFAEGSSEYPAGYPFLLKSPSLEVPCSRALPRGLWPGQVIILRGLVLPEPKEPVNSGAGMQNSPAQHDPQTRHNGVGVLLVPLINSVVLGKSRHLSEAGVLSFPIRIKGERSSQS